MRFSLYHPPERKDEPPRGCLIWLSGLTCSEENFMAKAGAFPALARENLMVLCPDTSPRGLGLPHDKDAWDFGEGASFYVDATTNRYRDHYRMDTYVTRELPLLIQNEFHLGEKISLMGHSMGGHGALVLGLRNPQLFRSVSAFAPIAHPISCPWGQKAFTGYLGENPDSWAAYDASELVRAGRRHPRPILIDQGLQDDFLESQLRPQDLEAAVNYQNPNASTVAAQELILRRQPGYDHSYYFIASFIDDHVRFHAQYL